MLELLKLVAVFAIIIVLIKLKLPLYVAVASATAAMGLLFLIPPMDFLNTVIAGATQRRTVELLMVTYMLTLLQKMMNDRKMLQNAEGSITQLLNNRRLNAGVIPATMGLLPSPASVLIAGPMMEHSVGDHLSKGDLAFVTTYFRHIPEAFLPLYSNVILICTLSHVPEWQFVLGMLPYVLLNIAAAYFLYIRKIPKGSDAKPDGQSKGALLKEIFRNLWPIAVMICTILFLKVKALYAIFATIVLYLLVSRTSIRELPGYLKASFNYKVLLSMLMVMVFSKVITYTGIAERLQDILGALPIPTFLVFALIFFFGSVFCNFTTMIPVILPVAMEILPSPLAAVIMLASVGHMASQICPTHVCILLCADYFKVKLDEVIKRTLPVLGIMAIVVVAVYLGMTALFA